MIGYIARVGLFALVLVATSGSAAESATIAVWPFDSHVVGTTSPPSEQLVLQEMLPDMLGAALSVSPRLRLVERQRLHDVLNEQKLGSSVLAEEQTRLRLGRLLGARLLVFGSHMRIGDAWQLDIRVVEVETSRILASSSESGQGSDYVAVAQRMAGELIRTLP
jgi:curli biogenesis system outer membrane secretion channel CsgG